MSVCNKLESLFFSGLSTLVYYIVGKVGDYSSKTPL